MGDEQVRLAREEERRHLARELHDRVSAGLGIAFRQLELAALAAEAGPADRGGQHLAAASRAVVAAMEEIRALTAGLHTAEPVAGLEHDLLGYLESAGHDGVAAAVLVHGAESGVPLLIRDEVFLILREALRNALFHGRPAAVRVRIEIGPDELSATVDDDGAGFDPVTAAGAGIRSMRERASILGGSVRLSSQPGRGTRAELNVPLTWQPIDEAAVSPPDPGPRLPPRTGPRSAAGPGCGPRAG